MPILYHSTSPQNLSSIQTEGLRPSLRWKEKFPPVAREHPILHSSLKLIFLVDSIGTTGPETFLLDVLEGSKIPLRVGLPDNFPVTNIGFGMGIWVTTKNIPPHYIEKMTREEVEAEVF